MGDSKKVLLIGWDAADWKVIHPLMDQGKMPALQHLVDRGVMAHLATLNPPLSPMLWTSIATGKRPFKPGVYGFTAPPPHGRAIQPITNLARRAKAIWNILHQQGMTSNVVGWWPSHPAEPIRGVMVSNHFQQAVGPPDKPWPMRPGTVHPAALADELAELRFNPMELGPEHILPFIPKAAEIDQDKDRRLAMTAKILAECTSVHGAATHLLETTEWDFLAVYYDAIDHFSHGFMKYHPPRRPHIREEDFELYSGVVEAGYRYHDMMLGTLLRMIPRDTTVILMSDHGFHPDHLRPVAVPREPAGPAVEHRPFGILVMAGPGIRKDELIHGANLLDICPTLLTLYDLPIGEDMDGRPLTEAFEEPPAVETIPSWDEVEGDAGTHPEGRRLHPLEAKEALDQLVALGYIDKPGEDTGKAVEKTVRELEFNLARAYMDADRYGEAADLLEKLHDAAPSEYRYGIQLSLCYRALDRPKEMLHTVERLNERRLRDAAEARRKLERWSKTIAERRKKNGLPEKAEEGEDSDVVSKLLSDKEKQEILQIGRAHV